MLRSVDMLVFIFKDTKEPACVYMIKNIKQTVVVNI